MKPVIVTIDINKSKKVVWNAITNHSQMIQWFFNNIPSFEPKVGFKTEFNVVSNERNFLHLWKVVDVKPREKIICEWQYPEYSKEKLLVTFKIEEISESNINFSVVAFGIEYFEDFKIPEFSRESCLEGWGYFTKELKSFVEK